MAFPYKALQICVKCSADNSETVGHKDLMRFGQIVYVLVFYNIHFLGFFHWTVSNVFLCRVYFVIVKTNTNIHSTSTQTIFIQQKFSFNFNSNYFHSTKKNSHSIFVFEMQNKQMEIIVSIKNTSFLHRLKGIIKP